MQVIFLCILKWIGIIIAVLLGLLLLLCVSIVFVPIRYRIEGCYGEKKEYAFCVHWLLYLISVRKRRNSDKMWLCICGIPVKKLMDFGDEVSKPSEKETSEKEISEKGLSEKGLSGKEGYKKDKKKDQKDNREKIKKKTKKEKKELQIEIPDRPVFVFADREALERIFANLLQNGVRYAKSELRISIEPEKEGRGASIVFQNDIDPSQEENEPERLFDRFYMQEHSRGKGGTGLGLTISRHLAQHMGGTLRASYVSKEKKRYLALTVRLRG